MAQIEMGLTKTALERRIAKGANVTIQPLNEKGKADVTELLRTYVDLLIEHEQHDEAATLQPLLQQPEQHFFQVIPKKEQADPSVSTE